MSAVRLRVAVVAVVTALAATLLGAVADPAHAQVDRYAYGDSVMLGARSALRSAGFRVDAHESRQAYSAPATMRKRSQRLPRDVVVHLGTNGTFPRSTCDALVRALAPQHRLFLVTVHARRSWVRSNNAMLRACARAHADQGVRLVDWDAAATAHPSWLYSDGIHLRSSGARGYARLLDDAVARADGEDRAAALAQASGSGHAALTR